MVRIYAADTAPLENAELFEELYHAVSALRREKTDRMRFPKDKRLSLGVEYLLMGACQDFGIDYHQAQMGTDANLKPRFADAPVAFNLSHSGARVLCIMAEEAAVGCDVEQVRSVDMLKLAQSFFAPEEYQAIAHRATAAEQADLFFRIWTCKESFMKCTGLGFRLAMNQFVVETDRERLSIKQSLHPDRYDLFAVRMEDGYQCAWCIKNWRETGEKLPSAIQWRIIGAEGMRM